MYRKKEKSRMKTLSIILFVLVVTRMIHSYDYRRAQRFYYYLTGCSTQFGKTEVSFRPDIFYCALKKDRHAFDKDGRVVLNKGLNFIWDIIPKADDALKVYDIFKACYTTEYFNFDMPDVQTIKIIKCTLLDSDMSQYFRNID
ncbi:uncharacterized protein LOC105182113 [Harpegnathos saltator]|uniref:uncharacterized protein LOC105182113 n=1 Tax=Harpegnathos saltator TaxID=610380 RepID=UPI0005908664|nr:uncharacterized protein LOC105182113 [Harpegnathos saltator]